MVIVGRDSRRHVDVLTAIVFVIAIGAVHVPLVHSATISTSPSSELGKAVQDVSFDHTTMAVEGLPMATDGESSDIDGATDRVHQTSVVWERAATDRETHSPSGKPHTMLERGGSLELSAVKKQDVPGVAVTVEYADSLADLTSRGHERGFREVESTDDADTMMVEGNDTAVGVEGVDISVKPNPVEVG